MCPISRAPEGRGRLYAALVPGARLAAVAAVLFLAACARNRVRTERIPVPAVQCADCLPIIEGVLQSFNRKGSESPAFIVANADPANGVLAVTFDDSKAHLLNFVAALNAAGFDAADRRGAPEAKLRLPECCR